MIAYMDLGPSEAIKAFTIKGVQSATYWKTASANIDDVETYYCIPQNETYIQHTEIFQTALSNDCQTITSPDMNNIDMLPPSPTLSPIRKTPSPKPGTSHDVTRTNRNQPINQRKRHTNNTRLHRQINPSQLKCRKYNTDTQTTKDQRKQEKETQTQTIHTQEPMDKEKDKRENLYSN